MNRNRQAIIRRPRAGKKKSVKVNRWHLGRQMRQGAKRRIVKENQVQTSGSVLAEGVKEEDVPEPNDDAELLDDSLGNTELRVGVKFVEEKFKFEKKYISMLTGLLEATKILKQENPSMPNIGFTKMGVISSGEFIIIAKDKATRDWLLNSWTVPRLDGRKLRVFYAANLSSTIEVFRVFIKVNKELGGDLDRVMRLLALQNQGVGCENWKIACKVPLKVGALVIFDINRDSRVALNNSNWKVWLEFMPTEVKFYSRVNHKNIFNF